MNEKMTSHKQSSCWCIMKYMMLCCCYPLIQNWSFQCSIEKDAISTSCEAHFSISVLLMFSSFPVNTKIPRVIKMRFFISTHCFLLSCISSGSYNFNGRERASHHIAWKHVISVMRVHRCVSVAGGYFILMLMHILAGGELQLYHTLIYLSSVSLTHHSNDISSSSSLYVVFSFSFSLSLFLLHDMTSGHPYINKWIGTQWSNEEGSTG